MKDMVNIIKKQDIENELKNEEWLRAEECIKKGLIDELII